MQRVQVRLSDAQAAHLTRRAAAKGATLADMIRDAIDEQLVADERQRRIDVALAALKKPAFRADVPDLSENHDEYFVQAIEERIGRR
jgi:hypothetical protein